MDLCGIPIPAHVQGESIRTLLADPKAPWDTPALTTYKFQNHAVRTEGWRYIHYADGGEELYDESKDPYEWTNLANDSGMADQKKLLGKWLPTTNAPDIGGRAGNGAEEGEPAKKRKQPVK
jgi:hypothetical protein